MRDYARIACKIRETTWLITEDSLEAILQLASNHINNPKLSDQEIDARLALVEGQGNREEQTVVNGLGILPIVGPIFGKANLMTKLSGATSLEVFQSEFRSMMSNDAIHSILLSFDTPGGSSDMVQEIADEIRTARDNKPVYSLFDIMCGSAGLWLAMQGNKVYSTPSGTGGSLGAYTVHQDQSAHDAQQGVKFTFISAGQFKTEGNSHEPLSEEGRAHRQEHINELFNDFKFGVALGRNTTVEAVDKNFGRGRMLTAKQALEVGMIDAIMPRDQVIAQLSKQTNRPQNVSVVIGDKAASVLGVTPGLVVMGTMQGDGSIRLGEEEKGRVEPGLDPDKDADYSAAERDKAIQGGWRRETPPDLLPDEVEAKVGDLNKQLAGRLNLPEDADDATIIKAVQSLHTDAAKYKDMTVTAEQAKAFAEQFPAEAARMAKLEADGFENEAKAFAARYEHFLDANGSKTKLGFPSVVLDSIQTTHLKFASNQASVADLTEILDGIATAGIVEYGERGSNRENDEDIQGDSRLAFRDKVRMVSNRDKISIEDALKVATSEFPNEFRAYQSAMQNNVAAGGGN